MEVDIANMQNTGEIPLKLELKLPYDPAIENLGIYTEKWIIEKTPVSSVHCSTAYNRQEVGAKQTSTDQWLDNQVVVATYSGILAIKRN